MKDMFGNLDTMCYQPSSTNTTGRNLLNHITRHLKANGVAESRPQMVRSGRKLVQDGQKKNKCYYRDLVRKLIELEKRLLFKQRQLKRLGRSTEGLPFARSNERETEQMILTVPNQ